MTEMQMNSVKQLIDYAKRTKEGIIDYAQGKGVTIDSLIEAIKMAFEQNGALYDGDAVERVIKFIQQKDQVLSDFDEVTSMLSKWENSSNNMLTTTPTEPAKKYGSESGLFTMPAEKVSEIPKISDKDLESQVTDIIKNLGIPAHIKGYYYLRGALIYLVGKKPETISMTKDLYPDIASKFKTKPQRVERAIRTAIKTAWERGEPEEMEKYFGYSVDPQKGNPTNSEFLFMIADHLKHQ